MAPYSTKDDADILVPEASTGWLFDPDTVDTQYPILAAWAQRELHSYIYHGTATPVTDPAAIEAVKEIEILLALHRRAMAVYASRDQEGGATFRSEFRGRAMGLLDQLWFPSSASAPALMTGASAGAGGHTLAVETFDDFTSPARWVVQCTSGGDADAVFRVWTSLGDREDTWRLSEGPWPVRRSSSDPRGMDFQIRLTMTGSGDFEAGDAFHFRTYGVWRRKMKRSIRMVDTRRRG